MKGCPGQGSDLLDPIFGEPFWLGVTLELQDLGFDGPSLKESLIVQSYPGFMSNKYQGSCSQKGIC